MHRRRRGPGTDLWRARARYNRHRTAFRRAARCAALAALAAALAGCALSVPVGGIATDATPTGSVDRTAALLSPALDREDLRRARAALAVALDPQGNGARAGWLNPQTGAHGSFTAAAAPFADQDRVCRRFTGEVAPAAGGGRRVSGAACRDGDGTWMVRGGESGA